MATAHDSCTKGVWLHTTTAGLCKLPSSRGHSIYHYIQNLYKVWLGKIYGHSPNLPKFPSIQYLPFKDLRLNGIEGYQKRM